MVRSVTVCVYLMLPLVLNCLQDYMIVFEEEVLPTADFLQFMAQCLDVVMKDTSLIGVSAWNDNGQYCIICTTVKKH